MRTQRSSTGTNPGDLAEAPKSLVTVWIQAAKVVLCDGGYRVIPRTSVETTAELPAYRMAEHLEQYVTENYPGLTLVDWKVNQLMCANHPHEPAEWDDLCQECWEELCAAGWWEMLRRAGL